MFLIYRIDVIKYPLLRHNGLEWQYLCLSFFRHLPIAEVGKLFRMADRFNSEIFSRTGLKININNQQLNFISAHITIVIQYELRACFAATRLSHLGIIGLNDTSNESLNFFDCAGPSSSTSDSGDGADLFPKNHSKDVCFHSLLSD